MCTCTCTCSLTYTCTHTGLHTYLYRFRYNEKLWKQWHLAGENGTRKVVFSCFAFLKISFMFTCTAPVCLCVWVCARAGVPCTSMKTNTCTCTSTYTCTIMCMNTHWTCFITCITYFQYMTSVFNTCLWRAAYAPRDSQTSPGYSSHSVQCLYKNHLLSVNKLVLSYLLLHLLLHWWPRSGCILCIVHCTILHQPSHSHVSSHQRQLRSLSPS